jgi:hypothetical protein
MVKSATVTMVAAAMEAPGSWQAVTARLPRGEVGPTRAAALPGTLTMMERTTM